MHIIIVVFRPETFHILWSFAKCYKLESYDIRIIIIYSNASIYGHIMCVMHINLCTCRCVGCMMNVSNLSRSLSQLVGIQSNTPTELMGAR